jgi:hypothetical protein
MTSSACNYDAAYTIDATCLVNDCANVCGGSAVLDQCSVCNGDNTTCVGCMTNSACNYNATATVDDGTCAVNDCANVCGGSAVLDHCGVCAGDGTSCVPGCMKSSRCNYNPLATYEDGSCVTEWTVCGVCGGLGQECLPHYWTTNDGVST